MSHKAELIKIKNNNASISKFTSFEDWYAGYGQRLVLIWTAGSIGKYSV